MHPVDANGPVAGQRAQEWSDGLGNNHRRTYSKYRELGHAPQQDAAAAGEPERCVEDWIDPTLDLKPQRLRLKFGHDLAETLSSVNGIVQL